MKKKSIGEKSHLKKNLSLVRVHPGHRSTRQIDRVLLDCCIGRSFILPRPVQPLGPELTRQADPGLITLLNSHVILVNVQE
jgi:hypothetical protein